MTTFGQQPMVDRWGLTIDGRMHLCVLIDNGTTHRRVAWSLRKHDTIRLMPTPHLLWTNKIRKNLFWKKCIEGRPLMFYHFLLKTFSHFFQNRWQPFSVDNCLSIIEWSAIDGRPLFVHKFFAFLHFSWALFLINNQTVSSQTHTQSNNQTKNIVFR